MDGTEYITILLSFYCVRYDAHFKNDSSEFEPNDQPKPPHNPPLLLLLTWLWKVTIEEREKHETVEPNKNNHNAIIDNYVESDVQPYYRPIKKGAYELPQVPAIT